MRGIKKEQGNQHMRVKRTPITPDLLRIIKFNLFNSFTIYEDKLMLWAAKITAFFGFLRVSEYTSPQVKTHTPETLCFNDVEYDNNQYKLTIKASKTDPFRCGMTVRLAFNGSEVHPVMLHLTTFE